LFTKFIKERNIIGSTMEAHTEQEYDENSEEIRQRLMDGMTFPSLSNTREVFL